jgi:hypothetical protein
LRWLLLLEEYGVAFEYLPGKKNFGTVADELSRLDIDSLKIQEEKVLTPLTGSENNSISNIKLIFPLHSALIFKEQAKVKEVILADMGLSNLITQYNILNGMIFFATKKINWIYIPQSLRQSVLSWYHEYLLHQGQTRTEKTISNTIIWPGITQDIEHWLFMFH